MEENNPAARIKQRALLKRTRTSPPRQRSVSSMRSTIAPTAETEQLLKEVANEIATNGQLIAQIGDVDQEILKMQLEIASLEQEYAFA